MTALRVRRPAGAGRVEALRRACRRAIWLDRFVRTAYLGMTALHPLLGAATAGGELSAPMLAGLVLVAACFHVHVFLINDVIDLEVDATQPRRADHPLVRGLHGDGVSKRSALALAWLGAALAAAFTGLLGADRSAWLALLCAFVSIDVYNVFGKRFPLPPLTDVVQGLGWWGLVLYGVWIANPNAGLDEILDRALPLLAFSMGFTVLITGIHGGLRDLVNDLGHGRTNTSIWLGARPAAAMSARSGPAHEPAVESSWTVVLFAFAVLGSMFWPSIGFLGEEAHFSSAGWRWAAVVAMASVFAANCGLLWKVVKPREPRRDAWVSADAVVLLLPPLVLYLLSDLPSTPQKWLVFVLYWAPLPFQARFMGRLLAFLDRRGAPLPEPVPPASSTPSAEGARRF